METTHLITLAQTLATHAGRTPRTVAGWCGVHSRLFDRLAAGRGCRVDTYNKALLAFGALWPADLEWPRDIPRPPKSKKEKAA